MGDAYTPMADHVDEWQNLPQCCKEMSPIKLKKKVRHD